MGKIYFLDLCLVFQYNCVLFLLFLFEGNNSNHRSSCSKNYNDGFYFLTTTTTTTSTTFDDDNFFRCYCWESEDRCTFRSCSWSVYSTFWNRKTGEFYGGLWSCIFWESFLTTRTSWSWSYPEGKIQHSVRTTPYIVVKKLFLLTYNMTK